MKKIISGVIGTIIIANTLVPISVNAKVVEPEIVKTETWIAYGCQLDSSSQMDSSIRRLLPDKERPLLNCSLDVYNDGTIKVYGELFDSEFFNVELTHHMRTIEESFISGTAPVRDDSLMYDIRYNHFLPFDIVSESGEELNIEDLGLPESFWNIDLSSYPKCYSCYLGESVGTMYKEWYVDLNTYIQHSPLEFIDMGYDTGVYATMSRDYDRYYANKNSTFIKIPRFSITYFPGVDSKFLMLTLKPTTKISSKCDFRLLGHSFSISPEMLSKEVIAESQPSNEEPKIKELEEKISNLEEENAKLKSENEHLLDMLKSQGNRAYGDMDNNGFVDGRDATILLTYYAKTSVGYIGTLEEFISSMKENNNG